MTMANPWEDLLGGNDTATSSANFQTWTLGSIVEDQLHRRHGQKKERVQELIGQLPDLLYDHPANDWWPMKELDPDSFYFDVMQRKLSTEHIRQMQIKDRLQEVKIPALF